MQCLSPWSTHAARTTAVIAPIGGGASGPRVAVLVPCFNEAASIGDVVSGFRAALPEATVYVYDNNSGDGTAERAAAAGAVVRHERLQGKGHVVRRMFADVEADVYVLVDGDGTYPAPEAPRLVAALARERLDLVNGRRVSSAQAAYRRGHRLGNRVLTGLVQAIFGNRFSDILSGYKVFSRRFAKSFPGLSGGFEIETELTIHALELDMAVAEFDIAYSERPADSPSKLNTIRDGIRILATIVRLVRLERPLAFFSAGFGLLAALSVVLAIRSGDLSRDRPGAAIADRDPLDRADAARLPIAVLRPHPGNGDARAAGSQAHDLSIDSRSPRIGCAARRPSPGQVPNIGTESGRVMLPS